MISGEANRDRPFSGGIASCDRRAAKHILAGGCRVSGGVPVRRGRCVLVVDDDHRVVNFVTIKLKASGFEVVSAMSGASALDRVRSFSPDLMVIDMVMPDKNGVETIRELRKTSPIPVVLISGYDVSKDLFGGLGKVEFLPKPFNPDALVARVRAMMKSDPLTSPLSDC
ncbi:MAG: response regulator [Dehalococcoidia bacterium]|nr:response regulator [Dehalococcoidia bacterium]